jgi:hypothetical protein
MDDTKQYLEELIKKVSGDLIRMYPHHRSREYGLIFPRKRDGTLRISEQESKFFFGQHIMEDQRYYFSVETPTEETYQQSGAGAISARSDLTLYGQDLQRLAHIELKAHHPDEKNIRKDLEKLVRERRTGLWFHTLERADDWRWKALLSKFKDAFERLSEYLETTDASYLIAFLALETGVLKWRWVQFEGELGKNLSAVRIAFDASQLDPESWNTNRFEIDRAATPAPQTTPSEGTSKGKGAREGFFVLIPSVESKTFLHLSIRGGSYKLRNYQETGPSRPPRAFTIPGFLSADSLRESGLIARWLPVTTEDSRYNVDTKPDYWYERISQINKRELPG